MEEGKHPDIINFMRRPKPERKTTMKDFVILKQVGKGSYGTVFKARRRSDSLTYAIKTINLGSHLVNQIPGYFGDLTVQDLFT